MVELMRVTQTLEPWLGEDLVRRLPRAVTEAQRRLNAFEEGGDSLDRLSQSLEGLLYSEVRRETGGRFVVTLADGGAVKMEPEDFAVIADELLWLLFDVFPADAAHLRLLRDYTSRTDSLSARRALYGPFRDYETADELKALRRQIRGRYPDWRWQGWLRQYEE